MDKFAKFKNSYLKYKSRNFPQSPIFLICNEKKYLCGPQKIVFIDFRNHKLNFKE